MEEQKKESTVYYTVDLLYVCKYIWRRLWIVLVSGVVLATAGFCVAEFVVTPRYESSVLLYVRNEVASDLSASDLDASQSLVNTCGVILYARSTLEYVIRETGVAYDAGTLSKMVEAVAEDKTEVLRVTVTSTDPYEAAQIANSIARVLPDRVAEIVKGASVTLVDEAVPNLEKAYADPGRFTVIGLVLGLMLSGGSLAVMAALEDARKREA